MISNVQLRYVACFFVCFQKAPEFVFIPTESEKSAKLFQLQYYVTKDSYCRVHNGAEKIQGWEKAAWKNESVFRKEENDWKMVRFMIKYQFFLTFKFSNTHLSAFLYRVVGLPGQD